MAGSADCLRWLLKAKADVNAIDDFGATALHLAVSVDPARVPVDAQLECVERLLASGADKLRISQSPAGDARAAATSAELCELLDASDVPGWKPLCLRDSDVEDGQEAEAFAASGSATARAAASFDASTRDGGLDVSMAPQPPAPRTSLRQASPPTAKQLRAWRPALYNRQGMIDPAARLEAATAAHHRLQTRHMEHIRQQKIQQQQQQQRQRQQRHGMQQEQEHVRHPQQRPPWRPALQRTQHETHHAHRRAYPSGQVLRCTGAGAGTTTYGHVATRRYAPPPDEHYWSGDAPFAAVTDDADTATVDAAADAADAATTFGRLKHFAEERRQHAGPATASRPGGPRRAGEPLTVGDVRHEFVDPAAAPVALSADDHQREAYDDNAFEEVVASLSARWMEDIHRHRAPAAAETMRRPAVAGPASFASFE